MFHVGKKGEIFGKYIESKSCVLWIRKSNQVVSIFLKIKTYEENVIVCGLPSCHDFRVRTEVDVCTLCRQRLLDGHLHLQRRSLHRWWRRRGQGFIYDTQNGQIKYFVSPENGDETKDASTEVRAVNPDGTGVGYVGDKLCKFDFNTGEYTDLGVNEPALANTMSTDGSVIGGFAWDGNTYIQHPIYLKDGVKHELPMPTSTWLGYEANGFGLTGANADGSMFLGYVQDDFAAYPICVWVLNQDGKTYSVIPVSKRFYDSSIELSGPQPMDYFNGAFMSANGRWVALSVHNKNNTEQSYTLARYDVHNDALEYISCPEATQTLAYYATAISDDGTVIGYINDEKSNARTGVICLAGDTVAHRLSEAFPQVPELAQLDVNELNTPCCIT